MSSALLSCRLMIVTEQSTLLPRSEIAYYLYSGDRRDVKEARCQARLTLQAVTGRLSWEVAAWAGAGFQPPSVSHGKRPCSQPQHARKAGMCAAEQTQHVFSMLSPLSLPMSRSQKALGPVITEENHVQKS